MEAAAARSEVATLASSSELDGGLVLFVNRRHVLHVWAWWWDSDSIHLHLAPTESSDDRPLKQLRCLAKSVEAALGGGGGHDAAQAATAAERLLRPAWCEMVRSGRRSGSVCGGETSGCEESTLAVQVVEEEGGVAPIRVGRYHAGADRAPRSTLQILERDGRAPGSQLTDGGGLSACATGDLDAARALHATGGWSALHAVDKHGSTALMWSASYGHGHVARWLLEDVGVDIDARNKAGRTALMFAAKYGQLELASLLLEAGADVSLRMKDDSSAFDWAVLGGHQPTMELLAGRVDLAAVNRFGCAAVQWAAAAGNVETLRWLQRRGVDLGHVNAANHGAVVKAAWKGHDDALRWLLLAADGPRLTGQLVLRDKEGRSVDEMAAMNGMEATARWLAPLVLQADAEGRRVADPACASAEDSGGEPPGGGATSQWSDG